MFAAVLLWRTADLFHEQIDETAAGGVADLLGNLTDRLLRADEQHLGALDARVDDIISGGKAGAALEHMGKVGRAQADGRGEILNRNGLADVGTDILDGLLDRIVRRHFLRAGSEQQVENPIDARRALHVGFHAVAVVELYHVIQQIADERVVLAADKPVLLVGDAAAELVRVGAVKVHIDKFQTVLCVVVVRLNAVDEQDVSGLGDTEFAAVLYAEASPADVDDEQRRIAVALHIVIVGAEIVTAPGRVEQQVFRSLRWSERETYGFAENTGVDALHVFSSLAEYMNERTELMNEFSAFSARKQNR